MSHISPALGNVNIKLPLPHTTAVAREIQGHIENLVLLSETVSMTTRNAIRVTVQVHNALQCNLASGRV